MVQNSKIGDSKTRFRSIVGRNSVLLVLVTGLFLSALAIKSPCLKPVMGWNSYDCYGYGVTQAQFMANAHYIADNLKKFGWQYAVVDFIWWIPQSGATGTVDQKSNWSFGNIDANGRFMPDPTRFPSSVGGKGFKPLADSVHNLGLKFGLHLMRGVPRMAVQKNLPILNSTYTCTDAANKSSTCPWLDWMYGANDNAAGQAYITSMVSLCDSWGVDLLKIDDLSAATYHTSEVVQYANAIAAASREIVFSTSPGPTPVNQAKHVSTYANMWRLVNDLWDTWDQLTNAYTVAESWIKTGVSGPGHFPDVDMLPMGHLSLYGPVGNTRYSLSTYTKGEHKLMMFMFCIFNNPLQWGGNLLDNKNDKFYDSLMTNQDLSYIDQNCTKTRIIKSISTNTAIWAAVDPADTNTKYLLFSNISGATATMSVNLSDLGMKGTATIKDVWSGKSLSDATTSFSQSMTSHNSGLYILKPPVGVIPGATSAGSTKLVGEKTYTTSGACFVVPNEYAGKTVKINVYSLSGKLLNSLITRNRIVNLHNGAAGQNNIAITKVSELLH